MGEQATWVQVPTTLNHGMQKYTGHLVLGPGVLYFICDKTGNLTGALIASSVVGGITGSSVLMSAVANEIVRDVNNLQGLSEDAVAGMDELIQKNPGSFASPSKEIGYIKRGLFGTSMSVGTKKYALLHPGIAKEHRSGVKAWCVTHNVMHKGLG